MFSRSVETAGEKARASILPISARLAGAKKYSIRARLSMYILNQALLKTMSSNSMEKETSIPGSLQETYS